MAPGDVFGCEFDQLPDLGLNNEQVPSRVATQAFELELQKQQTFLSPAWNATTAVHFERLMDVIVLELQPTKDDYFMRLDVVHRVSSILSSLGVFRGFMVLPFGSFESNLYSRWGDLDLSMELPENESSYPLSREENVRILKLVKRILMQQGEARKMQFIPHARVPLLTFEDSRSSISCDFSVDNGAAFLKSRLLRWISDIDPRCRSLIFLVKCWAKAHCINDPKMGTLNSYALCLLVVFHLQTRAKPILPPLNAIIQEDIARKLSGQPRFFRQQLLEECWENIQSFVRKGFRTDNKSSVPELFISFVCQFSSVSDLWLEGLAVCTSTGTWGDRGTLEQKWRKRRYVMTVEDPFDRSENCARSVHEFTLSAIRHAFSSTIEALYYPPAYSVLPSLREHLFCWPLGSPKPGTRSWPADVAAVNFPKRSRSQNKAFKNFVDTPVGEFLHNMPSGRFIGSVSANRRGKSREYANSRELPSCRKDIAEGLEGVQATMSHMHGSLMEDITTDQLVKIPVHGKSTEDETDIDTGRLLQNLHDPGSDANHGLLCGEGCSTASTARDNREFKESELDETSSLVSKKASRSRTKTVLKRRQNSLQSKEGQFADLDGMITSLSQLDIISKNVSLISDDVSAVRATSDTAVLRSQREGAFPSLHIKERAAALEHPLHSTRQAVDPKRLDQEYHMEHTKQPMQEKLDPGQAMVEGFGKKKLPISKIGGLQGPATVEQRDKTLCNSYGTSKDQDSSVDNAQAIYGGKKPREQIKNYRSRRDSVQHEWMQKTGFPHFPESEIN